MTNSEYLFQFRQFKGLCPQCGESGRMDSYGGAQCSKHGTYPLVLVPEPKNPNAIVVPQASLGADFQPVAFDQNAFNALLGHLRVKGLKVNQGTLDNLIQKNSHDPQSRIYRNCVYQKKDMNGADRVHPIFYENDRLYVSSKRPNILQFDKETREVFEPEDGFVFVKADFKCMEVKVAFHIGGEDPTGAVHAVTSWKLGLSLEDARKITYAVLYLPLQTGSRFIRHLNMIVDFDLWHRNFPNLLHKRLSHQGVPGNVRTGLLNREISDDKAKINPNINLEAYRWGALVHGTGVDAMALWALNLNRDLRAVMIDELWWQVPIGTDIQKEIDRAGEILRKVTGWSWAEARLA